MHFLVTITKNCTKMYIILAKNRLWWTPEYQLNLWIFARKGVGIRVKY